MSESGNEGLSMNPPRLPGNPHLPTLLYLLLLLGLGALIIWIVLAWRDARALDAQRQGG